MAHAPRVFPHGGWCAKHRGATSKLLSHWLPGSCAFSVKSTLPINYCPHQIVPVWDHFPVPPGEYAPIVSCGLGLCRFSALFLNWHHWVFLGVFFADSFDTDWDSLERHTFMHAPWIFPELTLCTCTIIGLGFRFSFRKDMCPHPVKEFRSLRVVIRNGFVRIGVRASYTGDLKELYTFKIRMTHQM